MKPAQRQALKDHIKSLDESQARDLIAGFFLHRQIHVEVLHSNIEHGMDLAARVDPDQDDVLHRQYNIIIQVKPGQLDQNAWRKVLYQLLETPYYRIGSPQFTDQSHRRILLLVTGDVTPIARDSIKEFNLRHEITVEEYSVDELVTLFEKSGYAAQVLESLLGLGEAGRPGEFVPEAVGEQAE